MESYEKEWLADQPALLAILHCVGLFDRPASADCLKALRTKPAIRGLTDGLVGLSDEQWPHASNACAKSGCWRLWTVRPGSSTPTSGARWFGGRAG